MRGREIRQLVFFKEKYNFGSYFLFCYPFNFTLTVCYMVVQTLLILAKKKFWRSAILLMEYSKTPFTAVWHSWNFFPNKETAAMPYREALRKKKETFLCSSTPSHLSFVVFISGDSVLLLSYNFEWEIKRPTSQAVPTPVPGVGE